MLHPIFQQITSTIFPPEAPKRKPCGRCGGQGDVTVTRNAGDEDEYSFETTCPVCTGDGFMEEE